MIYAGAEAENILSQGFNQMPVDGEALLEGVVSRKKACCACNDGYVDGIGGIGNEQ